MDLETILTRGCARDWEQTSAADTEPVRFAVVGVGWFTLRSVLPAVADSDRCRTTVLVSGSPETARQAAATHTDGATVLSYEEYAKGTAADEYDAVYVCTPNARHLDDVRVAADLGKAVLCEKPMERDVGRARELVETCASSDVRLMVAYRMHTEPTIRRAKDLIEAGFLGRVQRVEGSMCQRLLKSVNPDPDQWRLDEELAGGGALMDIGVYPLNTARFLLEADPIRAGGSTGSNHDAFDAVDEWVSFDLAFPDGVTAGCFASHNARRHSHIAVTGTDGHLAVAPAFFQERNRGLHVSCGDGRATVTLDRVDQMREEFDYFADRLRSGAVIYPDGEHGLQDMEVMAAIYESARHEPPGGPVTVS